MEQQIHPCMDSTLSACGFLLVLLCPWLGAAKGFSTQSQDHPGAQSCFSAVTPGFGALELLTPSFGKLTLVAAGGRGTAGRNNCPALGCKNLKVFDFFFKDLSCFSPSKPLENLPYLHAMSGKLINNY